MYRRVWEQKIMETINSRSKASGDYVVLRSEQVFKLEMPCVYFEVISVCSWSAPLFLLWLNQS